MLKRFLLSEEGEIVEWIVGAVIIGLGSIVIIAGIAQAILQVSQQGEERIRGVLWSGY